MHWSRHTHKVCDTGYINFVIKNYIIRREHVNAVGKVYKLIPCNYVVPYSDNMYTTPFFNMWYTGINVTYSIQQHQPRKSVAYITVVVTRYSA